MAYNYSRYQYETSPRKLQPDYEPEIKKYPKKSTGKKTKTVSKVKPKQQTKRKMKTQAKVMLYVALGFAVLFAISYRNSIINEKFSEIKKLKTNLAAVQKENQQLEVNIENNLNLKTVEQSAKELLGMQKADNSQTVYINLPKEDYVEPATEEIVQEDTTNWFQKIINVIMGK